MIGVSAKLASSSASRMTPTRPSIMSEGATMSAPASACETATRASSSSVGSLRTVPPSTMPQCPWLVYWHRHTSVRTSRSGTTSFTARTACCTMPSSAYASEPRGSFSAGKPNNSTPGIPARDVLHVLHQLVDGETELAGHRPDRLAHAPTVDDEQRIDKIVDGQRRLADQLAEQRLLAETSRTEHCMRHHSLLLARRPAFLGIRAK